MVFSVDKHVSLSQFFKNYVNYHFNFSRINKRGDLKICQRLIIGGGGIIQCVRVVSLKIIKSSQRKVNAWNKDITCSIFQS